MTWDLRLGDCLDPVTGLASLADKSVDHVICDPPYEAEAHTLQRRLKVKGGGGDYGEVGEAPLDFAAIDEPTRKRFAGEAFRVSRRWVIAFCQAEAVGAWREVFVTAGLTWKRACVWVKPDGMPQLTGDRPGMGYESIACAHGDGRSRWNGGGKCGVYTALRNFNGGAANVHPTQKPLALMEALIRDFTDPGETVCDPFAGSGTTGVACIRLGRNFIGWEKDPRYYKTAFKRLSAAREQMDMFERRAG